MPASGTAGSSTAAGTSGWRLAGALIVKYWYDVPERFLFLLESLLFCVFFVVALAITCFFTVATPSEKFLRCHVKIGRNMVQAKGFFL